MAFCEGFNHTGRALIQLGSSPAVQVFAIVFVAMIATIPLNISENFIAVAEAVTVFLIIVACGLSAGNDTSASKLKIKMAKVSEDEQPVLADATKPVHTEQASIPLEKGRPTKKRTRVKKKETTHEVKKKEETEEVAEPQAQHLGLEGTSGDVSTVSKAHLEDDTCLPMRPKQTDELTPLLRQMRKLDKKAREADRLHKKRSDGAELSKEEQQKLAQKDAIAAELAELQRRHEAGETGEAQVLATAANAEIGLVPSVQSAPDVSLEMKVAATSATEEFSMCSFVQALDCTSEPPCEVPLPTEAPSTSKPPCKVPQPTEASPEPLAKTVDPRLQPCPNGILISEERAQKLACKPNVCWEWITHGVCPRGLSCKWQHPPVCAAAEHTVTIVPTPLRTAAADWQHPSVYAASDPTLKIMATPLSTAATEWQHPSMYAVAEPASTIVSTPLSTSASTFYPLGVCKASL